MPNFVTTSIIQDTRREKKDGTFPIKLRLTFERKQKYYKIPFDLTKADFERAMFNKRLTDNEKTLKHSIQAYENKATDIINSLSFFSWELFEKQFFQNRTTKGTISEAFKVYINYLKESERIGTAGSYECAERSLSKFAKDVKFSEVTPDFLTKYQKMMLTNGKSATTVGIYLRSLRTIFNIAISEGTILKDVYPFGKRKFEIPIGRNVKKALSLSEISLIFNYKAEAGTTTEKAKDLWVFMYLCNGINIKDVSLLKYENIKGDILEFSRAKTVNTKRVHKAVRVVITEDVKRIIEKWGIKNKDPKNYIFPILEKGLTPTRQRQLIQQLTQLINKHLKNIANELGIEKPTTTYVARHSFATVLKRSGVGTEFISEALDHNNINTTNSYLAGFEDESLRETVKALTAFKTL